MGRQIYSLRYQSRRFGSGLAILPRGGWREAVNSLLVCKSGGCFQLQPPAWEVTVARVLSFGGSRSFSISIARGLGQCSILGRYEGGCFGVGSLSRVSFVLGGFGGLGFVCPAVCLGEPKKLKWIIGCWATECEDQPQSPGEAAGVTADQRTQWQFHSLHFQVFLPGWKWDSGYHLSTGQDFLRSSSPVPVS